MKGFERLGMAETAGIRAEIRFPDPAAEGIEADASVYSRVALVPVQVHSNEVAVVDSDTVRRPVADAVVTFEPGLSIGVVTADCVPVLLYAPDICGVAAVHAGWKGTLGGIVDNTVRVLCERGADPSRIIALFGPSISGKVYEVSEELGTIFTEAGFGDCVSRPNGAGTKPHIDLQEVNVNRMLRCGLLPGNIHRSEYCTFSSTDADGRPLLPSHRRSGGKPARLLSCIKLY